VHSKSVALVRNLLTCHDIDPRYSEEPEHREESVPLVYYNKFKKSGQEIGPKIISEENCAHVLEQGTFTFKNCVNVCLCSLPSGSKQCCGSGTASK